MDRRGGFTVIEVLVSAALAASLMVAVMSAIGLLAKQQREIRNSRPVDKELARAISLLKWDLQVGHSIESNDERVTITGFGGRNPTVGVSTQRPTQVTYETWVSAGESYLLRRQAYLDAEVDRHSEEFVYQGIQRLRLVPVDDEGTLALRKRIIPRQLRIVLQLSDSIHDERTLLDKLAYRPTDEELNALNNDKSEMRSEDRNVR